MQNGAGKRQMHICRGRALKRLAAAVQRGMAAASVVVLCFLTVFPLPLQGAERGQVHHVDTEDYCLRACDVTVKMSELQGMDLGEKQTLVEKASAYAFYKWEKVYEKWGEAVSGYGDFGSVNWDLAASYTVTVRMPALTKDLVSEVSYTLTIVDDLPAEPEPEPEPPAPALYRVTVCYLDEETGEALKDDYVIGEIEEGTVPEIGEEIFLAPEGYTAVEILGDLEGQMTSDREILIICRRLENAPQEPEDPEDPDGPGEGGEPDPEDPEGGNTDPNGEPEGQEGGDDPPESPGNGSGNSEASNGSGSGHHTGKNTGKTSGKTSGRGSSGKKNSTASSGRTGAGQSSQASSGAPQPSQAPQQSQAPLREQQGGQTSSAEETVPAPKEPLLTAGDAEIPDAEAEKVEEASARVREEAAADTALAGGDQGGGQAAIGGAVTTQAEARKERYPLWSMALATAEGGILAVLGYMIFSDLKLILWFENKKRR